MNIRIYLLQQTFLLSVLRRPKQGEYPHRQRTIFTTEHSRRLVFEFQQNDCIIRYQRIELAQTLNLTDVQIKIWFQNRQAKDKRLRKLPAD